MSASWPSAQTSAHPELSEAWGAINDLQTSKLWHQLGEKLTTLIADPYFTKHPSLLTDLFTNVVKPAVRQLSPIVVANIAIAAARSQSDAAEGISFLKSVSADVSKNASASVLLLSSIASLQAASGKIHGAVATIDSASGVVSGNIGPVAAEASAALHQASAELARARGNAAGFFEHSLLSLTYRDVDAIPDDEKTALATEIAAAAIVGDGVYSFGELISHPLMASLESAPAGDAALGAILRALDAGDLDALAKLRAEHGSAGKGAAGRVFSENAAVIDDKARVSALGVRVFELSAAARTVPIATVAKWVGVSEDEADAVVIRAVALGVVRAEIDGVEQTVRFSWTMPRVLSQVQLEALRDRVGEWRKTAEVAVQFVTDNTKELLP